MPANAPVLTFGDLILRIAQMDGTQTKVSGERDRVPTGEAELQRFKDAINDARGILYIALDPATGRSHDWNCLKPTANIALPFTAGTNNPGGNTNSLYIDPSYDLFDQAIWVWSADGGSYSGEFGFVHPEIVESAIARSPDTSGHPRLVSLASNSYAIAPGVAAGKLLRVWPKPDVDYTLIGPCRRLYLPLVNLGDIEPMGPAHAQTIIAVAMFVMRRGSSSVQDREWFELQADKLTAKSIQYDKRTVSMRLGNIQGTRSPSLLPREVSEYERSDGTVVDLLT